MSDTPLFSNLPSTKHHDLTEEEARAWLDRPMWATACACLGPDEDAPTQPNGERLCRCAQRWVDAKYALGEAPGVPNG